MAGSGWGAGGLAGGGGLLLLGVEPPGLLLLGVEPPPVDAGGVEPPPVDAGGVFDGGEGSGFGLDPPPDEGVVNVLVSSKPNSPPLATTLPSNESSYEPSPQLQQLKNET